MKLDTIQITFSDVMSKVYFHPDLLTNATFPEINISSKVVVIIDETVYALIGSCFMEIFKKCGRTPFFIIIPPGEKHKTRSTKQWIEDKMLEKGCSRDTTIVGIGGGVVLDMAGFVAATYSRGIPFISIPTTLLAMVDACLGGKTGVNVGSSKNAIGSFYPASSVWIDSSFLYTLPDFELKNGLAEVIKYGLIADPTLIDLLQRGKNLFLARDSIFLEDLIVRSLNIKKRVIEKDPKERGLRRILNFGHTIGHAIETALDYSCPHGEAVATGMALESYLSVVSSALPQKEFDAIIDLLLTYEFTLSPILSYKEIKKAMSLDKKSKLNIPRFVQLCSIGCVESFEGEYCGFVKESFLEEAFSFWDTFTTSRHL